MLSAGYCSYIRYANIFYHEYGNNLSSTEFAYAQSADSAVPLDVVPERRTEWCSPRFRSSDRF